MKKLDVRFDTVKVNRDLKALCDKTFQSKSGIARAAMNIGLERLLMTPDVIELIEEYNLVNANFSDRPGGRVIESAIVKREIVKND